MILVDTSVWINHFREGNPQLEKLLLEAEVMCHPFIIGELACGNIKNRTEILSLLQALPISRTIDFNEYLFFIDKHKLMGRGIGFVDIHLLASAQLTGIVLWTMDKRLNSTATQLELAYIL